MIFHSLNELHQCLYLLSLSVTHLECMNIISWNTHRRANALNVLKSTFPLQWAAKISWSVCSLSGKRSTKYNVSSERFICTPCDPTLYRPPLFKLNLSHVISSPLSTQDTSDSVMQHGQVNLFPALSVLRVYGGISQWGAIIKRKRKLKEKKKKLLICARVPHIIQSHLGFRSRNMRNGEKCLHRFTVLNTCRELYCISGSGMELFNSIGLWK